MRWAVIAPLPRRFPGILPRLFALKHRGRRTRLAISRQRGADHAAFGRGEHPRHDMSPGRCRLPPASAGAANAWGMTGQTPDSRAVVTVASGERPNGLEHLRRGTDMKWLSGSNVRTIVVSGGVAAVTALAVAGVPALAQGSAPAASATPIIVSGVGHHTVFLGGSVGYVTIGTLNLGRGAWTIFAKAEVSGQTVQLHCKLTAGSNSDQSSTNIDASSDYDEQVALNVTHVFARAGHVVFACSGSGVSEGVFNIKMTAIKAGTLINVRL